MDDPQGRQAEQPAVLAFCCAGVPQPVLDHAPGVGESKGCQGKEVADPVGEVRPVPQLVPKFRLGKDHRLQEFVGVGFKVEQLPQGFQAEARQLLAFVDDQDNDPLLRHALGKQIILERLLDFTFRGVVRHGGDGKEGGEMGEEFAGCVELRVQDEEEGDLFSPVIQAADQLPAEGGLAGANLAQHDIESLAQADGQLQVLQTGGVLPGIEKELRIRRVGKWFTVQVQQGEVFHGCAKLFFYSWSPFLTLDRPQSIGITGPYFFVPKKVVPQLVWFSLDLDGQCCYF